LKDKAKDNNSESNKRGITGRKKPFTYSLFLMDLDKKIYIAFGSSMK